MKTMSQYANGDQEKINDFCLGGVGVAIEPDEIVVKVSDLLALRKDIQMFYDSGLHPITAHCKTNSLFQQFLNVYGVRGTLKEIVAKYKKSEKSTKVNNLFVCDNGYATITFDYVIGTESVSNNLTKDNFLQIHMINGQKFELRDKEAEEFLKHYKSYMFEKGNTK